MAETLHQIAFRGDVNALRCLLEQGADVNSQDNSIQVRLLSFFNFSFFDLSFFLTPFLSFFLTFVALPFILFTFVVCMTSV